MYIVFPDGSKLGICVDPETDLFEKNRYCLVMTTPKKDLSNVDDLDSYDDLYDSEIYFHFNDFEIGVEFLDNLFNLLNNDSMLTFKKI